MASLDEIDPEASASAALDRIAPALVAALARFDAHGFAAFAERFAARDVLRGRAVVGADGGVGGTAAGIADDGALLVDTDAGVVAVASGEWRLRVLEGAEPPC